MLGSPKAGKGALTDDETIEKCLNEVEAALTAGLNFKGRFNSGLQVSCCQPPNHQTVHDAWLVCRACYITHCKCVVLHSTEDWGRHPDLQLLPAFSASGSSATSCDDLVCITGHIHGSTGLYNTLPLVPTHTSYCCKMISIANLRPKCITDLCCR